MSHYLAIALLTGLLIASCRIWLRVIGQFQKREEPLPFQNRAEVAFGSVGPFVSLLIWMSVPDLLRRVVQLPAGVSREHVQLNCGMALLSFVLILVVLRQASGCKLAEFGIHFSEWPRSIRIGIQGFVACVLPVTLAQVLTMVSGLRGPDKQHSFLQLLRDDSGFSTVAWIGIAVIVVAPLAEELLFRVVIQTWLKRHLPTKWSIVVVALVFSAVHAWPDPIPLFPLALILGYVYDRSNSYVSVVVLHSLFNTVNLIVAIMLGAES